MGQELSMDPQIAQTVANVIALEALASNIEANVKSTTLHIIEMTKPNLAAEAKARMDQETEITVNQTIRGRRTVCLEFEEFPETQKYRCYVVLEIDEDAVLKPVHEGLKKNPDLQGAIPNYEKFKEIYEQF
jgi:hypothetical protein